MKSPIIKMIITALLWSTGGVLIKLLPYSSFTIAGLRSLIAIVPLLIYAKPRDFKIQSIELLGAIFYAATLICFVTANKLTTASNAIVLQFTSPLWIVLYLKIIKKEVVSKKSYLIILTTMLGMFLCVQGTDLTTHGFGNFIAVLSGISFAGMILVLKKQASIKIIILGNFFVCLVSLPFTEVPSMSYIHLLYLILLGVFQIALPYILYTQAISHVSTLQATLLPFLEPLFNPIWVMLFVQETPSFTTVLGSVIVLVSIVYYQSSKEVY